MTTSTPLLVGLGNPFRRDDGVGTAVVELMRTLHPAPDLDVVEASGEASELVDLWRDRDVVLMVDAAVSGAPAGSVHRLDCAATASVWPPSPVSSHGLSVADAIALALTLDALPRTLVVFAVEAADLSHGRGLSAPVADAVAVVADAVLAEAGDAAWPATARHPA